LISDDGRTLPPKKWPHTITPEQYRLRLVSARGKPSELLRRKMIRRLGHFRRNNGGRHDHCVRFFYDGSLCEEEIADLFLSYLDSNYDKPLRPQILFHGPWSPWLERAVIAVGTQCNLQPINLAETGFKKIPRQRIMRGTPPPLIILDMVDTGETVTKILNLLNKVKLKQRPKVLTVLTTRPTDRNNRIREIEFAHKRFPISYLLDVKQVQYDLGKCPMCKLHLPFSSEASSTSEPFMLSSYDMWGMAFEAGIKEEEDVPKHRQALPLVPKYPEIIENNGAWLASKIRERLHSRPEGFPADAIVVCPDERGSRFLTDYLRLVLGISTIRIPRNVIDACAKGRESVEANIGNWTSEPWYIELDSSTKAEIIVMDEFNVSGGTLTGIRHLLTYFDITVKCYFPLNDLNPNWSRQCGIVTYTLYRWQASTSGRLFKNSQ